MQGPEATRVLSAEPFPASQLEGPLNQTTCRRPHQLDIDQNQTIKNATDCIFRCCEYISQMSSVSQNVQ